SADQPPRPVADLRGERDGGQRVAGDLGGDRGPGGHERAGGRRGDGDRGRRARRREGGVGPQHQGGQRRHGDGEFPVLGGYDAASTIDAAEGAGRGDVEGDRLRRRGVVGGHHVLG